MTAPSGGEQARRAHRVPAPAWLLGSIAVLFFALPLVGMLQRAPWSDIWHQLTASATLDALRLSIVCSLAATALALLFGVPLAWVLAHAEFPGRRLTRAVVMMPMVLPPVVGGIALFLAFGRRGLVGQYLDEWFGVTLPFTTVGAIVAETFVAMPFLVIAVEGALKGLEPRYEDAARSLGARRFTAFRRVTLPLIGPSLVAGAALSWARALGEFGATITFAGSFPGKTQTMPLAIFGEFEAGHLGGAIALSLVLVAISIGVLVGLRDQWLRA